jgi:hypothetical protein
MLNRNDFKKYVNLERPLANVGAQNCAIERAKTDGYAWRCVAVYHLSPEENQGKHQVFVDVLNSIGQWVFSGDRQFTALRVGWTWEGRRLDEPAPLRFFEKREPEPKAQVDLYKGQTVSIWIDSSDHPSDKVHGLRSDVEIGTWGNTLFHNSFVVLFQLTNAISVSITPVDPPLPSPVDGWVTVTMELQKPTVFKLSGKQPFKIEYQGG